MSDSQQRFRSKREEPLTPEEEDKVWDALHKNMGGDDKYPGEVMMRPPYNGNRQAYLNAMSSVVGIPPIAPP